MIVECKRKELELRCEVAKSADDKVLRWQKKLRGRECSYNGMQHYKEPDNTLEH